MLPRRNIGMCRNVAQFDGAFYGYPVAVVLVFAIAFLRAEGWLQGADSRDLWAVLLLPYFAGFALAWRRYR